MMAEGKGDAKVTELLQDWGDGNLAALDELMPLVYEDLRRRAAAYLRRERPNHTLQTTALVNEAYLRYAEGDLFKEYILAEQELRLLRYLTRPEWCLLAFGQIYRIFQRHLPIMQELQYNEI
jgi:hypothetical protein